MTLNGSWTLYYSPQDSVKVDDVLQLEKSGIPSVPATVPGNVELDLSAAGILPKDLFKGMNIMQAEQFEKHEWWYEKKFLAPDAPDDDHKVTLHFGAVDCIATYYLNGEEIGSSDNMFISYDFDVTEKIKYNAENIIHVHIKSAMLKGAEYELDLDQLSLMLHRTSTALNVRKAPHMYGWDIMPRAISAGLWRDVELRYEKKYDFKTLSFRINYLSGPHAIVSMFFNSTMKREHMFKYLDVRITGKCGDDEFTYITKGPKEMEKINTNCGVFVFTIPNIKLWWPKHYGQPNMYDLTVEFLTLDGEVVLSKTVRRGFRTVELRRSDVVEEGGAFEFVVNGQRIMATGSNWVPMDVYHSRDKARYKKALDMADDLGCNILRCWGGNVYEDHEFFDYCDDHGIMIWQDFAMACHYYPQNEPFMKQLEKEAEWVVKELRDHPSLVLWSGDNEIDGGIAARGLSPEINRLTREVLPRVVQRQDPFRPYIASSPYISPRMFATGNTNQGSPFYAEDHLWGPRDYFKSDFYKNSNAYFVSEVGYHGCPSKKSIEKFIDKDYVWPYQNNKQWNLHSSDQRPDNAYDGRTMLMHKQVQQLFGEVPDNLDDYALASQISQAEAKKFFIENMRARMDRNGGVIWWNLIDGWPQMSDAIVDYYYEKKLAYDYVKRSQRSFMIMLKEMTNWRHSVVTCNSTGETLKGHVTITDMDTGKVHMDRDFVSPPHANAFLGNMPLMYSDKGMFLIQWTLENGEKHFNTYLYGTPKFDFKAYKGWLEKLSKIED
ncbi:MAG: hypothetical protein IIW03_05230 [Clostridia bacterium]|nr:hypothetical protein [Clostridia bacterium]